MKKALFLFLVTCSLVLAPVLQAAEPVNKNDILKAINDGAQYAATVLLDEKGMSRCDYNLLEGKWYEYEPAWHTGQLIFGLSRAYQVTGNAGYLAAAKRAGDWWVSLEYKDPPQLKGMLRAVHGDHAGQVIYFATISDGSAGLFLLHELTGDRRYAETPTRAGQWMLEHMWVPDHGVFYDVVNPVTGEVRTENSPDWPDPKPKKLFEASRPNNEGSIFKDMYEFTGDETYKQIFIQLCESLVEKQDEYGLWMEFMPNHKEEGSFHPRFNLWYAESLLEGYELTGDRRYLNAAKRTAQFYAKFQQEDGTIYYKNYVNGRSNKNSVCGSAVSFAGIVWLRLLKYGAGEEFRENIAKSVRWVLKNRYATDHPDPNLAGGFFELRTRRKDGGLWITIRDIATSFGLRFLADYYEFAFGE